MLPPRFWKEVSFLFLGRLKKSVLEVSRPSQFEMLPTALIDIVKSWSEPREMYNLLYLTNHCVPKETMVVWRKLHSLSHPPPNLNQFIFPFHMTKSDRTLNVCSSLELISEANNLNFVCFQLIFTRCTTTFHCFVILKFSVSEPP